MIRNGQKINNTPLEKLINIIMLNVVFQYKIDLYKLISTYLTIFNFLGRIFLYEYKLKNIFKNNKMLSSRDTHETRVMYVVMY